MLSLKDIEMILGEKFVIYVIYKMWKMNIILYLFVHHIMIFVKSLQSHFITKKPSVH